MKGCNIVMAGRVTTLVCTTVIVAWILADTASCVFTGERAGNIDATGIVAAIFTAVMARGDTEGKDMASVTAGTDRPGTVSCGRAIPADGKRPKELPGQRQAKNR